MVGELLAAVKLSGKCVAKPRHIIFVDWHGVLSLDPFWASVLRRATHPLRRQIEEETRKIFADNAFVNDWMRGAISTSEVIAGMRIRLDRRFRPDFLARRLAFDCARMAVNDRLLVDLQKAAPRAAIVLATDNMDCFAHTIASLRKRRVNRASRRPELTDWADFFAEVICSSEIGALKAENAPRFFSATLSAHGFQFSDALLIDDRVDNCEAFRQQGGNAIQWRMGINELSEASNSIRHWLVRSRTDGRQ